MYERTKMWPDRYINTRTKQPTACSHATATWFIISQLILFIFSIFVSEIYNAERERSKRSKRDSVALSEHKRSSVLGRLSCLGRAMAEQTPLLRSLYMNEPAQSRQNI